MITTLSNFKNIQLENDISVITLDDGINHTYYSKIVWDQDNWAPIGTAKLIMPYGPQIEEYWTKYYGTVVIHANLNSMPQSKINDSMQATQDGLPRVSLNLRSFKERLQKEENVEVEKDENSDKRRKLVKINNDEYNYSFIGKVYRLKQVGKTFVVYLEDLGWKFMQKVPKEFRDTFIAGQYLDDAFQAICEFMGVEFAYSIKDLHEYNFSADGYSVEKDGVIIEDVPSILKEWANGNEEEEEEEETIDESMAQALDTKITPELGDLSEYKKNKEKNKKKKDTSNTAINATTTNVNNIENINQNENNLEDDKSNSDDINKKIEEYQEEFDEKIKDLFIGDRFYNSNTSDPVLNYDWITIEPKAVNNNTSTTGGTGTTGDSNSQNNNQEESSGNSGGSTSSSSNTVKNGWYNGQLYENGKIVLYNSYINSLSPKQAKDKAKQTNTYSKDTLRKLKIRAQGVRVYN